MSQILDYHTPPPPRPPLNKRLIFSFCLSLLTFPPATCLLSSILTEITPIPRFLIIPTVFILLPTLSLVCSFKALFHHLNQPLPRGQNLALAACILSVTSCLIGYILAWFLQLWPSQ